MSGLALSVKRDFLDALYGPVTGDVTVHLYSGHIDAGGVEITGAGYAPGTVDALGWEPADTDGIKEASAAVDCGTPTAAWSAVPTHYVLENSTGDSCGCFRLPSNAVGQSASDDPVLILPRVFFGENDI